MIRHLMGASQNICRNYRTTDNSPGMALSRGRSVIAQEDQHSDELDQENLRWVAKVAKVVIATLLTSPFGTMEKSGKDRIYRQNFNTSDNSFPNFFFLIFFGYSLNYFFQK